jgi:putative ABC transport system substrate-binding protein
MRRRDFITAFGRAATLPLLWPLTAQSEQSTKPYRLAYLALLPGENSTFARSFLQRLEELGYREGQNMIWDYRSAEGQAERLPQLAADVVGARPDVLIT